ncbi:MAG TPA: ABC transporter substrate-binding protein [Streptosporangiaceae bacterium]|jgi:ABC-type nitrate/sulfonate/bicarbonate transport system substrate-binding protein|nr:ABC transporter substrate-binding protein [Streptosporangiaceae bacterium]
MNIRRSAGALTALGAVLALGACSSSSASDSSGSGLTQISIAGSYGADFGLVAIAQQAGFFKKQGLDVKLVNSAGFSAASLQSAFLAGTYTFEVSAAASEILAASAGGQFKAIAGMDIGQQQQIAIAGNIAKKFHIPLSATTAAGTEAQIAALKGSHITIGISNTSGPSYNEASAVFKAEGITVGAHGDVTMESLGNTSTFAPALAAGKIDAFILPPPISDVKGAAVINLGNVSPVDDATGLYMMALDKTISQDKPTVQKTVNAIVEAWSFAKANPAKAEPMLASVYAANGITSPSDSEAHVVFNDDARYWVTPAMPQSAFQNALGILVTGQGKQVKESYGQLIDNAFVTNAAQSLKISVPDAS